MKLKQRLTIIRQKIAAGLRQVLTKVFWLNLIRSLRKNIPIIVRELLLFSAFFLLTLIFLINKGFTFFARMPLRKIFNKILPFWEKTVGNKIAGFIEKIDKFVSEDGIKRSYLISLAFSNMRLKKTRSVITIGGMAVGIGAIVFLVSLGYGLEKMVISRVARLEELKMADVSPGESTALRINKDTLQKIKEISSVEDVAPSISVVGRVNFKAAAADILAYAVPKNYFEYLQLEPMKGKLLENNETQLSGVNRGEVAGASHSLEKGSYGQEITGNLVHFNIEPEEAVLVWSEPIISSEALGFTRRIEGGLWGAEYWGGSYYDEDGSGRQAYDSQERFFLGSWLRAKVPLYQRSTEGKITPVFDENNHMLWTWGWLINRKIQIIEETGQGKVLGDFDNGQVAGTSSAEINTTVATAAASLSLDAVVISTDSSGIEWVEIKGGVAAKQNAERINFEEPPLGEAVISSAMLKMFNLEAVQAIGQKFKVSFVLVKSLMPQVEGKVFSEEVEYQIKGIVEDENTAYFYIPFVDLLKVGVSNYSQLKVVAENQNALAAVRKTIETMGYRTSSTVDTVVQIESLFRNVRFLLGFLGMVALAVAILGMFNTLTVSLLERTREIGGMKAMGMISKEVRDMLLAEAIIMGLSGGFLGLLLGFLGGKLLSLALSSFAVIQGQGFLNLTYIPSFFVIFILVASFAVGILTGIYPAKRATKISALNALRYE